MDPITWSTVVALIIRVGLPAATHIVEQWKSGKDVTVEDLKLARELGKETPESLLSEVLAAKGIAVDDPRAKQIFDLINSPAAQP